MSDTKALEILEKEDGTYLSIIGKRYSAMILLGKSEMAENAVLELSAELAQLKHDRRALTDSILALRGEMVAVRKMWKETIDELAELRAELDEARKVIDKAAHELGIPVPGYIQPVANAANMLWNYLDAHPKEKNNGRP